MDPVLLELVGHCNSSPRTNRSALDATESRIANFLFPFRFNVLILAVKSVSRQATAWAGANSRCGEAGTRNADGTGSA